MQNGLLQTSLWPWKSQYLPLYAGSGYSVAANRQVLSAPTTYQRTYGPKRVAATPQDVISAFAVPDQYLEDHS